MSDYTGPGVYEILPKHAPEMSVNIWGGSTAAGTALKLYQRTPSAENTHFAIVAAGGTNGKPEKGDREYHIIAVNSGLYVSSNGTMKVTAELRSPLDGSIRWKFAPAGDGSFYITNVYSNKQLNVRGAGKESGTDIITYDFTNTDNAKFFFKVV
ncbi:hypothetical protein EJ07DRAFT_162590 [Lizonia empirigonia]|nr:hypothetical protein EJ07DRAFT_162590 [Lizonia empirigonia]